MSIFLLFSVSYHIDFCSDIVHCLTSVSLDFVPSLFLCCAKLGLLLEIFLFSQCKGIHEDRVLNSQWREEKAMAPHSSTLAWRIPWTEDSGRLRSTVSPKIGHDWATSLSLFTFMHRRRKWQPTPVFLPGESQGRGSLVGCHLWGHTEWDTTEAT